MHDAASAALRMQAPAVVTDTPSVPRQLAAIDLGSNSLHLVIGRVVDGHLDGDRSSRITN